MTTHDIVIFRDAAAKNKIVNGSAVGVHGVLQPPTSPTQQTIYNNSRTFKSISKYILRIKK